MSVGQRLALLLLLLCSFQAAGLQLSQSEQNWIAQHPLIRVGSDPFWPPFELRGANGKHQGLAADYLRLLGEKLGLTFEVNTRLSWSETLKSLQRGELDALAALDQTPQRQQYLLFTEPYLQSPLRIYTRVDRNSIKSMEDLNGLSVAVEKSYKVEEILQRDYPQIQLQIYENTFAALQAVADQEVDAYVGVQATAAFNLGAALLPEIHSVGNGPAEPLQIRMASRRDWPELQQLLQKALDSLTEQEHFQIRQKWLQSTLLGGSSQSEAYPPLALNQEQKNWLKQNPVIELGLDGNWPPIDFTDAQNRPSGIVSDYLDYLQQRLGVRFEPSPGPSFKQMLERVENGELMLSASVARTQEREQKLWYSPPFFSVLKAIVSRDSSPELNHLKALYGRTVAIEDGFSTMKQLQQYPQIKLLPVENTQQALEAVAFGRADAYVGNRSVASWIIRQQQLSNLQLSGDPGFGPAPQHFVVPKKTELKPLIEAITLALEQMPESQRQSIEAKWLQSGVERQQTPLQLSQQDREFLAQLPVLRVGALQDWPPYGFKPAGQQWQGITADYLQLALEQLGVQYQVISEPSWAESLEMLKRGELDLMGSMAINAERREFLDFTRSYFWSPYDMLQRRENNFSDSSAELEQLTIAVERGYFLESELKKSLPKARLLSVDSTVEALQAVVNGDADVYFGNRSVALYLIKEYQWQELKSLSTDRFSPSRLHFGVRQGLQPLPRLLSQALQSISTAQRISIEQRWLGLENSNALRIDLQLSPAQQQWLQQQQPIRVASAADWAPISFINATQQLSGFSADLVQLLNQALNRALQIEPVARQQLRQRFNQGEIDVLVGVTESAQNPESMLLSQAYAEFPYVLYSRSGERPIYGLESLVNRKLLLEADNAALQTLQTLQREHPQIQIVVVDSSREALQKLAQGQADAFLGNLVTTRELLLELEYNHLQIAAPTPYMMRLHLAVRADWPELLEMFNQALSLLSDTQKSQLQSRWLTIDVDERYREQAFQQGLRQTLIIAIPLMLLGSFWLLIVYRQRQQIKLSEQRYINAVNAVSEGVWELNLKTRQRYFSPGFFKRMGYSEAEIPTTEDEYIELVHPHDRLKREQALRQTEQDPQGALALEYRLRRADGSYLQVQVEGHNNLEKKLRVGVLRDITEVREKERHIRRLLQALAQSPDLICILSITGQIEYANAKLLETTAYQEQEASGQDFAQLLLADEPRQNWHSIRQQVMAADEWRGEVPCVRKDGSEFWAQMSLSPMFNDRDEIIQLIAVVEDISEKRAAALALERSEEQLRHVITMLPLAIVIVDRQGQILMDNPQASVELGQQQSLVGHNTIEFYREPETRERILKQILEDGEVQGLLVEFVSAEQEVVECLVSATPVYYEEQLAILAAIVNISDRRAMERDLDQAKQQAEEANRFKSRFLANMSHEIRTPMNAIVGLSHLALQRDSTPELNDYLQKIQSSAHNLLGIINDILDISRIESGRLQIETAPFYLDQVLQTLSDFLAIKASEKQLELLFEVATNLPAQLLGDALRLGQVLTNLCGNALKFTETGEVRLQIQELQRDAEQIRLHFKVIDTGPGIAAEQQPGLFESFRQADESTSRRFGGSGLGLAISQQLVQAMGGEIQLSSELGQGSCFEFSLDFGYVTKAQRSLPGDIRGARILVVDDNATSLQIFIDQLSAMHFKVEAANNAAAALSLLQQQRFDLALIDWRMPGQDGLQLISQIRQSYGERAPALVLVTAYGREELMRDEVLEPLDGFLLKPVTPSLLFDTLIEALSQSGKAKYNSHSNSLKQLQGQVLLVEDHPINRQVAEELLSQFGLQVQACESAAEALEKIEQEHFAAALLDIQMPDMDGYQLAARLRAKPATAQLPLIAVTANAISGDREKALQAGFDEHVPKPIDPDLLYRVLQRFLPSQQAELINASSASDEAIVLPELDALDVEFGLSRVGSNRDLYARLLKGFARDFKHTAAQIEAALKQQDQEQAQRLVHTLRGVAANLGAHALAQHAEQLEAVISQSRTAELDSHLQQTARRLQTLLHGLDQWLKQVVFTTAPADGAEASGNESLEEILKQLEQELKTGSAAVRKSFQKLSAQLDQVGSTEPLTQLQNYLEEYEFELALRELRALREVIER